MLKQITMVVEVEEDINTDNLRLSIDEEGELIIYPHDAENNFLSCSIIEVKNYKEN